jgi:hypothetical protein
MDCVEALREIARITEKSDHPEMADRWPTLATIHDLAKSDQAKPSCVEVPIELFREMVLELEDRQSSLEARRLFNMAAVVLSIRKRALALIGETP